MVNSWIVQNIMLYFTRKSFYVSEKTHKVTKKLLFL